MTTPLLRRRRARSAPPGTAAAARGLAAAELAVAQVRAIEAWTAAWALAEPGRVPEQPAPDRVRRTREDRLDTARRGDALAAERAALQQHAARQQRAPLVPLLADVPPRAVVAHRQPWVREALAAGLRGQGLEVVHATDDGADACAALVAEQPDLLVCEDRLPYRVAEEVLGRRARFAPGCAVVVYGPPTGSQRGQALVRAGALAVLGRELVAPADVGRRAAEALLAAVRR